MKNKLCRIIPIMILTALLCVLLSACGLSFSLNKITEASIVVADGLVDSSNGKYTAMLGEPFTLDAEWDNKRVQSASVEWHIVCGSNDKKLAEFKDEKSLTYTFENKDDVGKAYEFYVLVEGDVKSDSIKVAVTWGKLGEPKISSSTHTIIDGIIQQNTLDGFSDVALAVDWDSRYAPEDVQPEVLWYFDNVKQATNGRTFVFDSSLIDGAFEGVVRVVVKCDGYADMSAQVKLVFVHTYALVDKASVSIDDNSGFLTVADGTYYLQGSKSSGVELALVGTISPDTANQNADCHWRIRNGENVIEPTSTARELKTTLKYGKNIITATIDNIESREIIVYVLTEKYDSQPDEVKNAIENKFYWLGNWHDNYISSVYDLKNTVQYCVSLHKTGVEYKMYLANEEWRNQSRFSECLAEAFDGGMEESGRFSYASSLRGAVASIEFNEENTTFGIPTGVYHEKNNVKQANCFVRYSLLEQQRDTLPIDNSTDSIAVSDSNQLYRAVAYGYKPIIDASTSDGAKLRALYEKARSVLKSYISEDMSELEKVAVIYDWVVNAVDYDYAVAGLGTANSQTSAYNAFYLEGVFNDHRAVCDGKSKAFALLCGMEGIKAIKVGGYANERLSQFDDATKRLCGHAWNKVLIDANGDGVREWYVVDTTWGDSATSATSGKKEYLNYAYFLKTDEDIRLTHEANTYSPKADTAFDVYKNTVVVSDGKEIDFYATTVAERDEILKYSIDNGSLCVCVYLTDEAFNSGKAGSYGWGYIAIGDNQYVVYGVSNTISF